ncbi:MULTISPECIES: HdeD family acid-resistance protein [unclassified Agromyces]|uniref:HdeD family acid-resistance protein n=1 Tax=unclassified Agromyces TaxID=2639701 RepID=UPI003014C4E9
MSSPQSSSTFSAFAFDSADLTRSAVNTIRVTLGITGVLALIAGIFITFWPKNSAIVLTVMIGIYFLIAGLAYVGLGIFSKGLSGGARALDIILGVLFVIGGILMLSSPSESAVVLGIFLGVLVGILWIIEGAVALAQAGSSSSKGWSIFFGLLSVIAGIVLLFSPLWGAAILFWVTGISLIVLGVIQIVRAFTFGRGLQLSA